MGRCWLLLLLACLVASARAGAQGANEAVVLRSATYASLRQIFAHAAPDRAVDVAATLSLPAAAAGQRGQVPAVVVVHTAAGFRDANEGWQAQELRAAGFATLIYDSFAARGVANLIAAPGRAPPPYPSAIADAFAALTALSSDPRIDSRRIAILGFSFGGEVAHDTAFERLRAALSPDHRFAAHVGFYPAGVYGVVADESAYTGAPVLLMIGGDDTLPVAKAEGYLAYAKAAGHPAPVELVTYVQAAHGWTDPGLGGVKAYPDLASTRKCPFILMTQHQGLALLVDGEARPFDDKALAACIRDSRGYTMGYDAAVRRRSTDRAIAFLRRHLAP